MVSAMQHCYELLFITGTVVASRIDALGAKARFCASPEVPLGISQMHLILAEQTALASQLLGERNILLATAVIRKG